MTDLAMTIEAKVDQLTADALLGGPITIKVTKVTGNDGADQPISIHYQGDDGKPFKPCKTMRRLLVHVWGRDGNNYAGRSMTLYRDPTVAFGGLVTGGVRISHVSNIEKEVVLAVTAKRGKKAPYTVRPLKADVAALKVVKPETATDPDAPAFNMDDFENIVNLAIVNMDDADTLTTWWNEQKPLRLQARDADKKRAGVIATRVADQIEKLKGDC